MLYVSISLYSMLMILVLLYLGTISDSFLKSIFIYVRQVPVAHTYNSSYLGG
jgi:hypothetical protein